MTDSKLTYELTVKEIERLWSYFAGTKEGNIIAMLSRILQRNAGRLDKENKSP